jgi:hypothetical protein
MALTAEQREQTAREITRQHYGEQGNTANLTVTDWQEALAFCDDWIEEHQFDFLAALPEPFRSTATPEEMRLLFVHTVMARVGLG